MSLQTLLTSLSAELRSQKVQTRNKAAEQLDRLLKDSKSEVMSLFLRRASSSDFSGAELFTSVIEAILLHSAKIEDFRDGKGAQPLRNKNYVFRGIITSLIDYNLEGEGKFLSKTCIFTAFTEGFSSRCAVCDFGTMFLDLLDRGIYKSPELVREIKVNEYSRILSYLFEINVGDNEHLRFATLNTIIKTIELATEYVQIGCDLVDYLPELMVFARRANTEQRRADVIKLFNLLLCELSIDYHHAICSALQDQLLVIIEFYKHPMKSDVKETFFCSIYLALRLIYPNICNGEYVFNSDLKAENWPNTLRILQTIIDKEVKELKATKQTQVTQRNFFGDQWFLKTAAVITYLKLWNDERNPNHDELSPESNKKKKREADKLDAVLNLVQSPNSEQIDIFWLAVLSELICSFKNIVNANNINQLLETSVELVQSATVTQCFFYLRRSISVILKIEKQLVAENIISFQYCSDVWYKLVQILKSNNGTNVDIVAEQQLLFQDLIAFNKLCIEDSISLLESFISNAPMKRNECIKTIQTILQNADINGFNKNLEVIERLLTWLYGSNEKVRMQHMIHGIAPIDNALVADTSSLAVVNFIYESPFERLNCKKKEKKKGAASKIDFSLLSYKRNIKFICIDDYESFASTQKITDHRKSQKKTCLFQNNYNLLMRTLNFEPQPDITVRSIVTDLISLKKIGLVMKSLIEFDAFDEENLLQCPLIKRIGFFLNQLEFQLKETESPKKCDIIEILHHLCSSFDALTSNMLLLRYLETQSLKELISFVGSTLKLSALRKGDWDLDESQTALNLCLHLLSKLCGSSNHFQSAFEHIQNFRICFPDCLDVFIDMIEIFCKHKALYQEIGEWFVNLLKTVFKVYYTHTNTIRRIIHLLPAIFVYVRDFEDELETMFVALASLLKVADRKSYSIDMTCLIIESVQLIAQNCSSIFSRPEFPQICLKSVKFLKNQSLRVQLTTIKAITTFVDITSINMVDHFEICEQIFSDISWKNLSTNTIDMEQNGTAVTVQTLASIFLFSYYHKEKALQELANFCSMRKLTEDNLKAFSNVADYYGYELPIISKPFVEKLLHSWMSKKNPALRFPFYLCSTSKDDFFMQNVVEIATFALLYGKPDDIKEIKKYASSGLLQSILPIAHAYILPYENKCPEATDSDYEQRYKNLIGNMNSLNIKFSKNKSVEIIHWKTIYFLANNLHDENYFRDIFGNFIQLPTAGWYNISFESLKCCLSACLGTKKSSGNGILGSIILDNPLELLHVLHGLQKSCLECLFPLEKCNYFFIFCAIADLIFESIAEDKNLKALAEKNYNYFMRDIIFFVLNFLLNATHSETRRIGLTFLNRLLQKSIFVHGFGTNIISSHLNDICKSLVKVTEESKCDDEIQQIAIDIINNLIIENKDRFEKIIPLLDEFPCKEAYVKFRQLQVPLQHANNNPNEAVKVFRAFLQANNRGIEGVKSLRQHIKKHRSLLQHDSDLLYELVNRLIMTVRSSDTWELQNECVICLGNIGSLQMKKTAYYFHTENTIYENDELSENSQYFYTTLIAAIDKIIIDFKPNTYCAVFEVCQKLVNSVKGAAFIEKTNLFLNMFRTKQINEENYLDTIASSPKIDFVSILKSTAHCSKYKTWVCDFMSKVFRAFGWFAFQELSSKNFYFADISLLPFIKLLLDNKETHFQSIKDLLESFFDEFSRTQKSNDGQMSSKSIYTDKRVVSKFLEACECIRICNGWTVPINLLNVCDACNFCQAYFMSIMYTELCHLQERESRRSANSAKIYDKEILHATAIKAYESIECTDAVAFFLNPLKSRLHFLSLRNDWSDVLLESSGNPYENELYTTILKRNGILSIGEGHKNAQKLDYEVCWRLCQWDVSIEGSSTINNINDMELEYQKHHFNALKSVKNQEKNNALAALCNARKCIVSILNEISIECLQSVYKYLTWLQSLQQVEDFCSIQFNMGAQLAEVFDKWKQDSDLEYGSFRHKEEILSHQIALFHTAGIRTNRKILEFYKVDPIQTCLLNCANVCKKAGQINLAKRNIARLRNIGSNHNKLLEINILLEDAEICFVTGKTEITRCILDHILSHKDMLNLYMVRALTLFGECLLETNSETFENVVNSHFGLAMKAIDKFVVMKKEILNTHVDFLDSDKFDEFERENRKKIYATIAIYAEREYMQLNSYINSEEYQTKQNIIHHNREAADSFNKQNKDRDKCAGANMLKKNAILDEKEMKTFEEKRIQNLCIAVENYIKFCSIDESTSEATIYKIIALWFSNKQEQELHSKIEVCLFSIPSYKFICALNQITGRLNSKNQAFLLVLKKLLIQCVQQHPHQTLYKLFPLVYAFNDGTGNKTNDRVEIAKEIILKGKTTSNANSIKQLESLFPALIEFANDDVTNYVKSKSMHLSDKLRKLKSLDAVNCPTIKLPASASLQYKITSIIKWNSVVTLVGGINAPKKLSCMCSDGVARPQLLKGKDDLRQDAVMQQVFFIINNLLASEPETSNRRLSVRTYNVVPLSMRSGILEWCENTIPIGMYLIDAHAKYRPDDLKVPKCRQLSMQHLRSDLTKRREIYDHICARIKPVLHFFLFEKFLVPGMWFERRLAYTNSVATNSIVGFILGIGDRHTQNILIDEKTAELVHIDFGIAFELGKVMPTPETVPFRLTRDIVAPMGVCKADGIFKKSCEATMEILRRHRNVILTILEVLLYDPLYMWKVLQQKTNNKETNSCEETNFTAQRTLLCVQNKLEGKQAGILGTSGVGVQVQRLINEAQLSHNLCQLYPGWDPYL